MEEIERLANEYADSFINSIEFKKLITLQKEIYEQLTPKIISFKTAEAKYLEALEYKEYYPNFNECKMNFIDKKKELYDNELVKEYKRLENQLQIKLDTDFNLLKKSISNKFALTKIINLNL